MHAALILFRGSIRNGQEASPEFGSSGLPGHASGISELLQAITTLMTKERDPLRGRSEERKQHRIT